MHVITDLSATEGAQTMLSRLVNADPSRATVVSLRGTSERNRHLMASARPRQISLAMGCAWDLPAATVGLARLIARERPAAVLCWLYHAMIVGVLAARLCGWRTRVYWTIRQSLDDRRVLSRNTKVAVAVARRMSGMCDGIIYNSRRARDQHAALGFDAPNVTVIPNGFVLPERAPSPARVPRVVGIAGRFHPQKDYTTFLRAAASIAERFPDALFVAAGRGLDPTNPHLCAAIAEAGLDRGRISFLGELDDMTSFFASVDLFVLSSRTEGFPNVVGEAMSHGLPVVATDVGDVALLVGETGFVVAPGDSRAIADAIATIMEYSPEAYAALARSAQQRIEEHFTISAIAARYRRFLLAP